MNLLLWLSLFVAPVHIAIEVTPRIQHAPLTGTAHIRVLVTIPKNPENRLGCVEIDGPTYRSSCFDIDGAEHATQQEWVYKGLVGGRYIAVASLRQADGKEYRARTTFCVVGDDNSGC